MTNKTGLQFTLKAGSLPEDSFAVVDFPLDERPGEPYSLANSGVHRTRHHIRIRPLTALPHYASAALPAVVAAVVGISAAVILNYLDKKFDVTGRVIKMIEAEQQKIVTTAREAKKGFTDLIKMDNMPEKGMEFTKRKAGEYMTDSIRKIFHSGAWAQ